MIFAATPAEEPIHAVGFKKLAAKEPCSTGAPATPPITNAAGKKICCACKETKSVRDQCIVLNGEDQCKAFIDAHNQCLRAEGFNI